MIIQHRVTFYTVISTIICPFICTSTSSAIRGDTDAEAFWGLLLQIGGGNERGRPMPTCGARSLLLHVEDDTAYNLALLETVVGLLERRQGLELEEALNLATSSEVQSLTGILAVTM